MNYLTTSWTWTQPIQRTYCIDLKLDVRAWKQLNQPYKIWKKFKTHFTKAINDNKSNTGTLKAILIANATVEAEKIDVVGTQTTR